MATTIVFRSPSIIESSGRKRETKPLMAFSAWRLIGAAVTATPPNAIIAPVFGESWKNATNLSAMVRSITMNTVASSTLSTP